MAEWQSGRVVVIHFVSTSNHNIVAVAVAEFVVVIHFVSTSNHNYLCGREWQREVVIHFVSTSNHNLNGKLDKSATL